MKRRVTGQTTRHDENLVRLARIEGQIRGIQRMIGEGVYCVDIITQIQAAESALKAVRSGILRKHMEHCVVEALGSGSKTKAGKKIEEVMKVLKAAGA
jgi:CsoR family transcriptional regulator, copper-sensing transcriptional repressor